ncbi:MAG: ABC-2 transporter permease [Oscillospiraceae bacterium]|nr:ABC-2 transporter permease [Oscillospiraceae bacterium]
MKGLLKKEWLVLTHKPMTLLVPVLLFITMSIAAKTFVTLLYLPVYAGILPVTLLTTDENSRWDRFALGMPYSRKSIVSAKYLMSLLLIACGCVLTTVTILFLMKSITPEQLLLIAAAVSAGSMLLASVLLPLNLQFGTAKARIALGVLLAVITCISSAAITHSSNTESNPGFNLFEKIAAWNISTPLLALLLLAGALILTAVSWALSVCIYRRKQF